MRLVIFRGKSLYGYLNRFTEAMAAALAVIGDAIVMIDTEQPNFLAKLQQALAAGPVDGFIGFVRNGLIRQSANNPYNMLDLPLVSIYLDPLLIYWPDVVTPIRRRLVFTTAPDDPSLWRDALGVATPPIRHLAHAAAPQADRIPRDQRDIDILFSGSGPADPVALRNSWLDHGSAMAKSLTAVLEAYDAKPGQSLGALILELEPRLAAFHSPEAIAFHFTTIDAYLRARSRWQMAAQLMELPTTFIGPGWDAVAAASQRPVRARLLGEQESGVVADLMRRTNIVASSCTPHHGTHERLFQAMAAEAVALTTETHWLREHAPSDALAQVRSGHDDVGALAAELLADPARADAMARSGRLWFENGFTWAHHAAAIRAGIQAARS